MSPGTRCRLGLGVVLLTMPSGYVASRVAGTHDRHQVINVSAALDAHIKDVANRYGVSAHLLAASIEAASSVNPPAAAQTGARRLMQLLPARARSLGVGRSLRPRRTP